VNRFFAVTPIDLVILAAAKVGGILANNSYPAEFIYQNLVIETNVIDAAFRAGIQRLLFLGSSCIYPKLCPQPIREEYLLTGQLEPTNAPYAVAKIAGVKLCEFYNRQYGTRYLSVMPTNLYGPNDSYDLNDSHVLPALIRKFHLAKLAAAGDRAGIAREAAVYGPIPEDIADGLGFTSPRPAKAPRVVLWGSGNPRREFLHVDDLAAACLFLLGNSGELKHEDGASGGEAPTRRTADHGGAVAEGLAGGQPAYYNIGTGTDLEIRELAKLVQGVVGFSGEVVWDRSKPDGTPRKLLDVSRIFRLGWRPRIDLAEGIRLTYGDYLSRLQTT
jgi:GDP-L-fucose synthase